MSNIELYKKEIASANILDVVAGTNCPQGGDSGHGGRTVFRLINQGGTDIRIKVDGKGIMINDSVEIVLGGDCECNTFIEALEFAINVYKSKLNINANYYKSEVIE